MLELKHITATRGRFTLKPTSFIIQQGEQLLLTGPTGIGKTTLLEIIAGISQLRSGDILWHNKKLHEQAISIGYVPQDFTLFRTMTVAQNLGFTLAARGTSHMKIEARVQELAKLLGLEHLLNEPAQHLSGGEAQRTAIGRAVAARPQLLLLDEPYQAQDERWRKRLATIVHEVQLQAGTTILHVTHTATELQHEPNIRVLNLGDATRE